MYCFFWISLPYSASVWARIIFSIHLRNLMILTSFFSSWKRLDSCPFIISFSSTSFFHSSFSFTKLITPFFWWVERRRVVVGWNGFEHSGYREINFFRSSLVYLFFCSVAFFFSLRTASFSFFKSSWILLISFPGKSSCNAKIFDKLNRTAFSSGFARSERIDLEKDSSRFISSV